MDNMCAEKKRKIVTANADPRVKGDPEGISEGQNVRHLAKPFGAFVPQPLHSSCLLRVSSAHLLRRSIAEVCLFANLEIQVHQHQNAQETRKVSGISCFLHDGKGIGMHGRTTLPGLHCHNARSCVVRLQKAHVNLVTGLTREPGLHRLSAQGCALSTGFRVVVTQEFAKMGFLYP